MRPDAGNMLFHLGQIVATEISSWPSDEYQQRRVRAMGIAILLAAEDIARGAEKLMEQNRAITTIFVRAMNEDKISAPLRERLKKCINSRAQDMTPGKLRSHNDMLRDALIALHEEAENNQCEDINDFIWDLLQAMTQSDRSDVLDMIFIQDEAGAEAAEPTPTKN